MPRRPIRDWITSEEAAAILGVTPSRFRNYLEHAVREQLLPNSVQISKTWLHYKRDVEKLKEAREAKTPRHRIYRRAAQPVKDPFSGNETPTNTDSD